MATQRATGAGRPRKPTALIKLEGGVQARKPKREPQPLVAYKRPPKHLSEKAREKWEELGPKLYKLGLLTEIDLEAFEALCIMYAKWHDAESEATVTITETATGYNQINPMISIARGYFTQYKGLLTEFGMSPASRSRIEALPVSHDDTAVLKDLLSGPRLIKK